MEKITKYYIDEYFMGREWKSKELKGVSNIQDIKLEEMNIDSSKATRVTFYEQSFIKDGDDIYVGESKSVSPVYYLGKRISAEEAIQLCEQNGVSTDYVKNIIRMNPEASFCKTDLGYLEMMTPGAITMSEYEMSNNKSLN